MEISTADPLARALYEHHRERYCAPPVVVKPVPEPAPEPAAPIVPAVTPISINFGRPPSGAFGLEPWISGGSSIPNSKNIIHAVCRHFLISETDLRSQRRTRKIVRPRQIAMYLMRTITPMSLPAIGLRMGGRDHTTVLHAYRTILRLIDVDNEIRASVEEIRQQFARVN